VRTEQYKQQEKIIEALQKQLQKYAEAKAKQKHPLQLNRLKTPSPSEKVATNAVQLFAKRA